MRTVPLAVAQQPVTHLGPRLAWTAVTLVLVVIVALLMRRGWASRARSQADLPPLPEVPADVGEAMVAAEGVYVSTTSEGDWLDRVVVHGLGARSAAVLTATDRGVLVERQGAPDLFVPAAAVVGVRLERGMAGKFVEEGGLVVLTWQHGNRRLDSGFRTRHAQDRDRVVSALQAIRGGSVR